jgi:signal transduction histidine kinase/CheY-like chemotaxis protein
MAPSTDHLKRVLVADDESIVVSLIRDTLEDEGHQVFTANDGTSALDLIRQHPFDLIVTDIRMPGMNGIELVKAARELQPELAVIFITGYADLNSAKDAIQQGAFDYIMKPFELTEIRTAVHKALQKKDEVSAKSSESHLASLSEMNTLLFSAGDAVSLVTSSLRFMMMQQHADVGSIFFHDREQNDFALITLEGDAPRLNRMSAEPLTSLLGQISIADWGQSTVVNSCEDHPLCKAIEQSGQMANMLPTWKRTIDPMILIPITRPDSWYGFAMLGYRADQTKLSGANLKFLNIASSQLAISLENLSLLKESQKAYSTLKELQEQTIELEKMATRGIMSAEIGHELNNFLAVVAGNLSLMMLQLKKQKFDHVERYAVAINDTVDKMTVFTRNLMDLTPMSSKKEQIFFDRLLSEVIAYVRPQKRFRGVEIVPPSPGPAIPFMADAIQIQQLLYNLFHNAADAMIDSQVRRITVKLTLAEDDRTFTLSIADTGTGFDPEFAAKAFQERFTTKPTGHGFGLVVCRRIIDNHCGQLHLESQKGQGATINITFPLSLTEEDTAPEREETVVAAT